MWLRQEHSKGSFTVQYLPTSEMPADGLTKNLSKQQYSRFKAHLNLRQAIVTNGEHQKEEKKA
jgi:hypothetical protein